MTIFYRLLSVFCLVLALLSCRSSATQGLIGEGEVEQKVFEAKDFHYISFALSGNVFIRSSNDFKVAIDAQPNILANIVTEMNGDTLSIRFLKPVENAEQVRTLIELPVLIGLSHSGSGNIFLEKNVRLDRGVSFQISGSGNIESAAPIQVEVLDAAVSGSGNIRLAGKSNRSQFNVSGSGNIDAHSLKSTDVVASLSGSGNLYFHAIQTLEATLSGSGNIQYKGKPNITKQELTGSGNFRAY
jgi:Putative auto-transporter adhesin, head GIN domain